MTWPELIGMTLQMSLWGYLTGQIASPRIIAYMTASTYPPEDDE